MLRRQELHSQAGDKETPSAASFAEDIECCTPNVTALQSFDPKSPHRRSTRHEPQFTMRTPLLHNGDRGGIDQAFSLAV